MRPPPRQRHLPMPLQPPAIGTLSAVQNPARPRRVGDHNGLDLDMARPRMWTLLPKTLRRPDHRSGHVRSRRTVAVDLHAKDLDAALDLFLPASPTLAELDRSITQRLRAAPEPATGRVQVIWRPCPAQHHRQVPRSHCRYARSASGTWLTRAGARPLCSTHEIPDPGISPPPAYSSAELGELRAFPGSSPPRTHKLGNFPQNRHHSNTRPGCPSAAGLSQLLPAGRLP
jgi:hypothetical protein